MFNIAISCLTTSNLPWLMDLIFQVPMWYFSYQHWTCFHHHIHPQTEHCFCFLPATSFFLVLVIIALCSLPYFLTYGGGIFWCHIFLLFHTVHGFLLARILEWIAISFSSDHILSELFTMTYLSWVALHGMAHSFIELYKPFCHNKAVVQKGESYHMILQFHSWVE